MQYARFGPPGIGGKGRRDEGGAGLGQGVPLLDVAGREVALLRVGRNDLHHLA